MISNISSDWSPLLGACSHVGNVELVRGLSWGVCCHAQPCYLPQHSQACDSFGFYSLYATNGLVMVLDW